MCILIHRPKGAPKIMPGWQADFWKRNSDGFGAWWIAGDKIVIRKTLKREEVAPVIDEIEAGDFEAGLHWRLATHGDETLRNCHPYTVHTEKGGERVLTCIGHNGVLYKWADDHIFTPAGERTGDSDTRQFIHKCFEPLVHAFGLKPMFIPASSAREILESCVSGSNKLLITNFKLGFTKMPSTGWTQWRGLHMSNTYAWSYSQREREDGPSAPVPFEVLHYPRYPGMTKSSGGSQNENGSSCASMDLFGRKADTCGVPLTNAGSPEKQTTRMIHGGPVTTTESRTSLVTLSGQTLALWPPDPEAGIETWHWGPPPQSPEGQALLDARIAEYRERWMENKKPNVAAVTAAVQSDAEVNAIAASVVAKISEGTGPGAAHKPVVEDFVPIKDPGPLKTVQAVVKEALAKDSIWRDKDAGKLIEEVYREVEEEGLPLDDDVTREVLQNMDFAQVVEWCREEPEEAAYLLQKVLSEKE